MQGAYTVKVAHDFELKVFSPGLLALLPSGILPGMVYSWRLTVPTYRAGSKAA